MINPERSSGHLQGEFSVFLIGMRVNRLWKFHKWVPVISAMTRMIKELRTTPDAGLLSYEMWLGRTTLMVQYWRSSAQLLAYAKNQDAAHYPAWRAFNQSLGTNGDVGIWHETYLIHPGAFEAIYVNMPAFGLGRAGELLPATGSRATAASRLDAAIIKQEVD